MIASAHGLVASPFKAGYVSAKHGVLGLVKTLALEGAARDPRDRASAPASSARRSSRRRSPTRPGRTACPRDRVLEDVILAPHAVKRLIEPEEVAATVSFLLGDGGRAFSGTAVEMALGWTAR